MTGTLAYTKGEKISSSIERHQGTARLWLQSPRIPRKARSLVGEPHYERSSVVPAETVSLKSVWIKSKVSPPDPISMQCTGALNLLGCRHTGKHDILAFAGHMRVY